MPKPIAPCLWFNNNAEEAVNFYLSVFKDSRLVDVDRYDHSGTAEEPKPIFLEFEINGQPFQAINGGPEFTFSEAISFSITCADQEELDYYWDALLADGGETMQCGWIKDRYGVSWQIIPQALFDLMRHPDREAADRTTRKMLEMVKLDIAPLQAAFDGVEAESAA